MSLTFSCFFLTQQGSCAKQPCERLIVSPRRQIMQEGTLSLLDSGRPSDVYVILFDDMLIITRRKKGLHKKVRHVILGEKETAGDNKRKNKTCKRSTEKFLIVLVVVVICLSLLKLSGSFSTKNQLFLYNESFSSLFHQKSSISESWGTSSSKQSSGDSGMKYVVYKQPLSLDRFVLHDVPDTEMHNAIAIVSLNRFQQVIAVHTLQANSEQIKVS